MNTYISGGLLASHMVFVVKSQGNSEVKYIICAIHKKRWEYLFKLL